MKNIVKQYNKIINAAMEISKRKNLEITLKNNEIYCGESKFGFLHYLKNDSFKTKRNPKPATIDLIMVDERGFEIGVMFHAEVLTEKKAIKMLKDIYEYMVM